jgi:hypothetical protein
VITFWTQIEEAGALHGIDTKHIAACILTETNGNRFAIRYEPHYRYLVNPKDFADRLNISVETEEFSQKTSWGLMQVMGGVARELGFVGHLPQLIEIEFGIKYGAMKLKKCMDKYGNIHDAIAAYNAGSVRKTAGGLYFNQKHVDRFDSHLRSL